MNDAELDRLIAIHGEDNRRLIVDAVNFAKSLESKTGVKFNYANYIKAILERKNKSSLETHE